MRFIPLLCLGLVTIISAPTQAADLEVLTTGAYLPVAAALASTFEARQHAHVHLANDTAGAVLARARAGTTFDLVILTPSAIQDLASSGIVLPATATNLAQVGVGVVIKAGAPRPDISGVDAFRQTLLNARSVAYIDPASGGSSGIYVAQMLKQLGIADQVAAHAVLVEGGRVADHIARGEADIGIHQISEIMPVAGVTLVGPLPAAIQSETIYTGAVSKTAAQPDSAKAFLQILSGPEAAPILSAKGMEPAAPSAHN